MREKASRPSILAAKPWHRIEHIRDSYRFKSVLADFRDVAGIGELLAERGVTLVKVDTGKLFEPKEWGWRIVVFDLRMPNGQLVEFYLPLRELEVEKKAGGHLIFEEWRNLTDAEIATRRGEYLRAVRRSFDGYQRAFDAALGRLGLTETEARASWSRVEASLADSFSKPRNSSGPTKPAGSQTPSVRSQPSTAPSTSGPSTNTRPSPPGSRSANTSDDPDIAAPPASNVSPDGAGRQSPSTPDGAAGLAARLSPEQAATPVALAAGQDARSLAA
jgi:hypothetical protein